MQRWKNSQRARTYPVLDFDTHILRDNLIVSSAYVELYWSGSEKITLTTQPATAGCNPTSLCFEFSPCTTSDIVGRFYYVPISSPGANLDNAGYFLGTAADCATPPSPPFFSTYGGEGWSEPRTVQFGYVSWVNRTGTSRYTMDNDESETGTNQMVRQIFHAGQANGAAHPARLRIAYVTSALFAACIDGEVAHGNSSCSGCSGGDFATDATSGSGWVSDSPASSPYCDEKQCAFYFDTSALPDYGMPSGNVTMRLTFSVRSILTDEVVDKVRVYGKQVSGSCPSSLGASNFVGCATGFTDLGVVTLNGAGTYSREFSSAGILAPTGFTEIVLVNATAFSDPGNWSQVEVYTTEAASQYRPKLEIVIP